MSVARGGPRTIGCVPRDRSRTPRRALAESRPLGTRLVQAWRALDREQQLAGCAAWLLFVSMFLPWYQQNAVVRASATGPLVSRNLSAFAVFSFVEALVLLLAAGVIALLFARAERRPLRLPASDGALIMGAGGWIGLLLVYRLFEKPGISSHGVAANVGIQWGIFFALLCAGLLIHAGSRMRSQRPPLLLSAGRLSDRGFGPAAGPPAGPAPLIWQDELEERPTAPPAGPPGQSAPSVSHDELEERPTAAPAGPPGQPALPVWHDELEERPTAPPAGPPGQPAPPVWHDELEDPPTFVYKAARKPAVGEKHPDPTPDVNEDGGKPVVGDAREDATRDARVNPARTTPDAHEDATRLSPVRGSRAGRDRAGPEAGSAADERLWQPSFEDSRRTTRPGFPASQTDGLDVFPRDCATGVADGGRGAGRAARGGLSPRARPPRWWLSSRCGSASRCSWRARPVSARPSSRRPGPDLGRELIRLQCYEGLDEAKALYEWNYRKQLLRIQAESEGTGWERVQEDIFSEEFLLARPLMNAITAAEPVVLLIDEIDKTDQEFEAMLLEVLSDFQLSIPELGLGGHARSRSCCSRRTTRAS